MEVILDTHTVVWWFNEPKRLSKRANSIITNTDNAVLVSAAVAWELSINVNLGKLDALALFTGLTARLQR